MGGGGGRTRDRHRDARRRRARRTRHRRRGRRERHGPGRQGVERHRRGHARRRLVRRLAHDLLRRRVRGRQDRRRGRPRDLQGRGGHHRDVRVLRRRLQRLGGTRGRRHRGVGQTGQGGLGQGLHQGQPGRIALGPRQVRAPRRADRHHHHDRFRQGRIADARRPVGRRGRRRHGRLQRRAEIQRREPCRALRPRRLVRLPRGPRRLRHLGRDAGRLGRIGEQRRRRHAPRLQVRRGHRARLRAQEVHGQEQGRRVQGRVLPHPAPLRHVRQGRGEHLPREGRGRERGRPRSQVRNRLGRRLVPRYPDRARPRQGRPQVDLRRHDRVRHRQRHRVHARPRYVDLRRGHRHARHPHRRSRRAQRRHQARQRCREERRLVARGACHRGLRRQRVEHRNLGVPVRPLGRHVLPHRRPQQVHRRPHRRHPAGGGESVRRTLRGQDDLSGARHAERRRLRPPVRSLVDRAHLHDRRADGLRRHHPQRDESGPHLRPRRREPLRPARPLLQPGRPYRRRLRPDRAHRRRQRRRGDHRRDRPDHLHAGRRRLLQDQVEAEQGPLHLLQVLGQRLHHRRQLRVLRRGRRVRHLPLLRQRARVAYRHRRIWQRRAGPRAQSGLLRRRDQGARGLYAPRGAYRLQDRQLRRDRAAEGRPWHGAHQNQ